MLFNLIKRMKYKISRKLLNKYKNIFLDKTEMKINNNTTVRKNRDTRFQYVELNALNVSKEMILYTTVHKYK